MLVIVAEQIVAAAVEEKILTHLEVEKCSVVGRKDPRSEGGQLPVAFLVLKNIDTVHREKVMLEVKAICEKSLPEYSQPVQFFVKDALPLTPAGKINFRALESEAQQATEG